MLLASGTHWAATGEAVGAILGSVGLTVAVVGVIFARRELRDAQTARSAASTISICQRWSADDLTKAQEAVNRYEKREDLREAYFKEHSKTSEKYFLLTSEPDYFEELATLWKLGAIDLILINEIIGSPVITRWRVWELTVVEGRKQQPTLYENFEELAKCLTRLRELLRQAHEGQSMPRTNRQELQQLLQIRNPARELKQLLRT